MKIFNLSVECHRPAKRLFRWKNDWSNHERPPKKRGKMDPTKTMEHCHGGSAEGQGITTIQFNDDPKDDDEERVREDLERRQAIK